MKIKHLLYLLFLFPVIGLGQVMEWGNWQLVGQIEAENPDSNFSYVGASISSNGDIMAIGEDSGTWIYQYGSENPDIMEPAGQVPGIWPSLNAEGNRVATCVWNGQSNWIENIKVFQDNNGTWEQLGNSIEHDTGYFWYRAELSADGTRLVAAAQNINLSYDFYIRVYELNGTTWEQVGGSFTNLFTQDYYDYYYSCGISISDDGNIVFFKGNDQNGGYVKAYRYDGTAWVQHGQPLYLGSFEPDPNKKVYRISTTTGGDKIAIHTAVPYADAMGNVYVYTWHAGSQMWMPTGTFQVKGQSEISISADGNRVATGEALAYPEDSGNPGAATGEARIFEYESGSWNQVFYYQPFYYWTFLGEFIKLSGDGDSMLAGYHTDPGAGGAMLFKYIPPAPANITVVAIEGEDEIIYVNETVQLQASILPDDEDTNTNLTWSVTSGAEYAAVDENGLVTGIAPGVATVKATSVADPTIFGGIEITVLDNGDPYPEEQPECEQDFTGDPADALAIVSPAGYWVANDFSIPSTLITFNLEQVSVPVIPLAGGPMTYSVSVYHDDGSAPGELMETWSGLSPITQGITGNMNGFDIYTSVLDLGESLELAGGAEYWLAITAELTTEGEVLYWVATDDLQTFPSYYSTDGGSTWMANEAYDGIFTLYGECVEETLAAGGNELSGISVFPNPTGGILNVESGEEIKALEIYDLNGRKLMAVQNKRIDISALPSGNYILKVAFSDGNVMTRKIIRK